MNEKITARAKLAELLGQLFLDGKPLATVDHDSPEIHQWMQRCIMALRQVSADDTREFEKPGNQLKLYAQANRDSQRFWVLQHPLRLNVLAAVKEQLELFDDVDQDALRHVKDTWELKANVGVIQGKIGRETTRKR